MPMTGAGLKAAREAARDAVTAGYAQGSSVSAVNALSDALLLADSNAIITYIQNNSVLVAITSDTGAAGTGIITGKVG